MTQKIITALKNIFRRIPENKRYIVFLIGGILIMFIVAVPELSLNSEKTSEKEQTTSDSDIMCDYVEETESRLCDLISSIKGAGKTKVMLTLDTSIENIYASDINSDKTEYVVIKTDSGESGMLLKIAEPEIRGVAVVCEGGDISTVKIDIINAVCSALGISSTKISIAKMKDRGD